MFTQCASESSINYATRTFSVDVPRAHSKPSATDLHSEISSPPPLSHPSHGDFMVTKWPLILNIVARKYKIDLSISMSTSSGWLLATVIHTPLDLLGSLGSRYFGYQLLSIYLLRGRQLHDSMRERWSERLGKLERWKRRERRERETMNERKKKNERDT